MKKTFSLLFLAFGFHSAGLQVAQAEIAFAKDAFSGFDFVEISQKDWDSSSPILEKPLTHVEAKVNVLPFFKFTRQAFYVSHQTQCQSGSEYHANLVSVTFRENPLLGKARTILIPLPTTSSSESAQSNSTKIKTEIAEISTTLRNRGQSGSVPVQIEFTSTPGCTSIIQNFEVKPTSFRAAMNDELAPLEIIPENHLFIAQHFSPFVNARIDQYQNPLNDYPIKLGFQITEFEKASRWKIVYFAAFSDEDTKCDPKETDGQMGCYGRASDIEVLYTVEFDSSLEVLQRTFHGKSGPFHNYNKKWNSDEGIFTDDLKNHPILFNIAENNVFDIKPPKVNTDTNISPPFSHLLRKLKKEESFLGYHLSPSFELKEGQAFDQIMLSDPSLYDVVDRELQRQNKNGHLSEEYLIVVIDGEMTAGEVKPVLKFLNGREFKPSKGITRDWLDGDHWLRESLMSGMVLPQEVRDSLKNREGSYMAGSLSFKDTTDPWDYLKDFRVTEMKKWLFSREIPVRDSASMNIQNVRAYLFERDENGNLVKVELDLDCRLDSTQWNNFKSTQCLIQSRR